MRRETDIFVSGENYLRKMVIVIITVNIDIEEREKKEKNCQSES